MNKREIKPVQATICKEHSENKASIIVLGGVTDNMLDSCNVIFALGDKEENVHLQSSIELKGKDYINFKKSKEQINYLFGYICTNAFSIKLQLL